MKYLLIPMLLLCSATHAFNHNQWTALLNQHVSEQRGGVATTVDYDGMAADRTEL